MGKTKKFTREDKLKERSLLETGGYLVLTKDLFTDF